MSHRCDAARVNEPEELRCWACRLQWWFERLVPPVLSADTELTPEEEDRLEVVPFRAVFRVRRDPLPRARLLAPRNRHRQ